MAEQVPLMAESYILDVLNFLKMHVTPEELRNPQPSVLFAIFKNFLCEFDFNLDCINMPPLHAYDFNNVEIYEEGLPLAAFMTLMKHLMQVCGFPDFSLKDLTEPKPKRTRRILSYIINFWRYAVQTGQMYKTLQEEYVFQAERRNKILKRIEEFNSALNEKTTFVAQHQEEFISESEMNEQLNALLKKKELEKEELSTKYQTIKNAIAEEAKYMSGTNVQIASEKEGIIEFEQQILKSPDRLRNEMEQLQQKCKKVDDKVKDKTSIAGNLKKHLEMQTEVLEELNPKLTLVDDTVQEINKIRNIETFLVEKQNVWKSEEKAIVESEEQLAQKEENLSILESNEMKENLYFQKRGAVLKAAIEESQKELERIKEHQYHKGNLRKKVEEQKKDLQFQLQKLLDDRNDFNHQLQLAVESIERKVRESDEAYLKEMDEGIFFLSKQMK